MITDKSPYPEPEWKREIRRRGKEEICGTCKYHRRESVGKDWACENPESDNVGYWTDYGDSCEEWEGR